MKSSTLRRSNLTREKIAMLDSLARYNNGYRVNNSTANRDKQKELDVLWQNFKVPTRTDKTRVAFFTSGVLVGAIATSIVAILISLIVGYSPLNDMNMTVTKPMSTSKTENLKFTFVPADSKSEVSLTQTNTQMKEYTVQAGDSLESISIKFYGGFDEGKILGIQEANQLVNPHAIGIGQKLLIPMN